MYKLPFFVFIIIILIAVILLFIIEQRNYAFSSDSTTQPPSAAVDTVSDGVIHVKLSGELEEAMLDLIKKEMSETSATGHVSQRLNARKLTVTKSRYTGQSDGKYNIDTSFSCILL